MRNDNTIIKGIAIYKDFNAFLLNEANGKNFENIFHRTFASS
jgi:hypothetical protein